MMKNECFDKIKFIESPGLFEVIIPVKRHWVIIIFLILWLTGIFFMALIGIGFVVFGFFINIMAGIGGIFWLALVSLFGWIGIRALSSALRGGEMLNFENGVLTISKKHSVLPFKTSSYSLAEIKKFRTEDITYRGRLHWEMKGEEYEKSIIRRFCFCFNYKGQQVRFATGITYDEANLILERLLAARLIAGENLM